MENEKQKLFLTDLDLADRYGVCRDSIHRWKRAGRIPRPVRLGDNTVRWSLAAVENYESGLANIR